MANTRAEAFAPATMANLGVGFDILGLAVDGAGDTITAERRSEIGAVIAAITGDEGKLPHAADKNVATIAANALLKAVNAPFGVALSIDKGLPSSSGLGSSAASSVAAVVAVNALLEQPFERKDLLPFALEGEAAVSGYHADNVAPCLIGGITLINGTKVEDIHALPVPDEFYLALVTPDVEVPTAQARAVLPEHISLAQMTKQTGAVAALIDAFYRDDVVAIAKAMASDTIVEPARAHLMPHIEDVRSAAQQAGALAVVISGAGPTLCAVCQSNPVAEAVVNAMKTVYSDAQIATRTRLSQVDTQGSVVQAVE